MARGWAALLCRQLRRHQELLAAGAGAVRAEVLRAWRRHHPRGGKHGRGRPARQLQFRWPLRDPSHALIARHSRVDDQSARPWTGITISGIFGSLVATQIEPDRVPRARRSGESATSMRKVALESKGACVQGVGTPKFSIDFAARYPARTYPCQRFTTDLAAGGA